MPLQATSGAASYDAFGGGVAAVPNYIEDVFSTWLYDGNSTARNIQNGIDLAGKGGMVWIKTRTQGATGWDHVLYDTARGANKFINSNLTVSENSSFTNMLTGFNSDGFSLGVDANTALVNYTGYGGYASWTFRKQPKFFDVVTYTGNGTAGRTISHNLGSEPGCIIVKRTDSSGSWAIYHRGLTYPNATASQNGLNFTTSAGLSVSYWNNTAPTSTVFTVGTSNFVNASGGTYVAYLFAHNAGGFGLTGTDNVISCGSYTGTGAVGNKITLGYEPQWLLIKRTDTANSWYLFDTMRGLSLTQSLALLPNGTNSDLDYGSSFQLNADGVTQNNANSAFNASGGTYIYIAIRRGPMKVPTSGTSVFSPVAYTGNATDTTRSAGFPVDMLAILRRSNPFGDGDGNPRFMDRLRGGNSTSLISSSIAAEETSTNNTLYLDNSVGFKTTANNAGAPTGYYFNVSTNPYIAECFRRAPGFFDEVCYTGTGTYGALKHNLGVIPEWIIGKPRSATGDWIVVYLNSPTNLRYVTLNSSSASANWGSALNTSTEFYGTDDASGTKYVHYLFATCAGVSKVGSYTGNGSSQTINCGFTGGARFVMVKATSTTGNWIVADSARGIVAGNDPALYLNSTAAEVTGLDWIDADNSGFVVNETATIAANTNGVSYIFFAVA